MRRFLTTLPLLAGLIFLPAGASGATPLDEGLLDCTGLTRVSGSTLGTVCVADAAADYQGAMLDEIEYGFQRVGTTSSSSYVGREAGTRYPVGPQQRKELQALGVEAFASAVAELGLSNESTAGSGVLRVRGHILDVLLETPQDPKSGAKYLFDTIGRATLVVELYDSETDELLLRAFDHRETEPQSTPTEEAAPSYMAAVAGLWEAVLIEAVGYLPGR